MSVVSDERVEELLTKEEVLRSIEVLLAASTRRNIKLRAALEEIASGSYQCGHGCASYARQALADAEGK